MRLGNTFLKLLACLCALATGCTASNSRLTTCQAEKEQLLTTIRTQRDTTRGLNEQIVSLESRLDQAEKELARGGSPTRFSSVPNRPSDPPAPAKPSSLPWRSPGAKTEPTGPAIKDPTRASSTQARDALVALSKRDRRVRYD